MINLIIQFIRPQMFVGSSEDCNKSCVGTLEELEKHMSRHRLEAKEEYVGRIKKYFNVTCKSYYQQKRKFIEQYFSELHNQINIRKMKYFKILEQSIIQAGVSSAASKYVVKDIKKILEGLINEVSCSSVADIERQLGAGACIDTNIFIQIMNEMFREVQVAAKKVQTEFKSRNEMNRERTLVLDMAPKYLNTKKEEPIKKARPQPKKEKNLPITLIKDIPDKGYFNVQVKLLKKRFSVQTDHLGTLDIFLVSDSSGNMELSYPTNDLLKKGNVVLIQNCRTRLDKKGNMQIAVSKGRAFSITLIEAEEQSENEPEAQQQKHRNRGRRRGGRKRSPEERRTAVFPRKPRQQRLQTVTADTKQYIIEQDVRKVQSPRVEVPPVSSARIPRRNRYENDQPIKERVSTARATNQEVQKALSDRLRVADISAGQQGLSLYVKIVQVTLVSEDFIQCVVGDESGIVNAMLPATYSFIYEDEWIFASEVCASVINKHIMLVLTSKSVIKKMPARPEKIKFLTNISEVEWQSEEESQSD